MRTSTHFLLLLLLAGLFFGVSNPMQAQATRLNHVMVGSSGSQERMDQTEWPHIIRANQLMKAFQFEEALFSLDNAIALNPFSAEALAKRAELKLKMGMASEAQQDLALANRFNPYAAKLHGYYGQDGIRELLAYEPQEYMLGLDQGTRLRAYRKYWGIEDEAKNPARSRQDSIAEQVLQFIFDEDYPEAMQLLDSLFLEGQSQSAIAHDLKGLVQTHSGDWEAARESFSKAVKLTPDFAISWYNLGKLEQLAGDWEQAKEYLDRAIDLQGDLAKAYFGRAQLLKQMGRGEEALEDYDALIDLEGAPLEEAFANRGLTRKMLGNYTGALADLNEAIAMDPESVELLKNRGNLQLIFGFPLEAIQDYDRCLRESPDFAEAQFNRGLAYLMLLDKVAACQDLQASAASGYLRALEMMEYFCGF